MWSERARRFVRNIVFVSNVRFILPCIQHLLSASFRETWSRSSANYELLLVHAFVSLVGASYILLERAFCRASSSLQYGECLLSSKFQLQVPRRDVCIFIMQA